METMTKAARLEVKILETLQNKRTAVGDKNCIRMVTDFTYRGHTCLVFEPMVRLSAGLCRLYGACCRCCIAIPPCTDLLGRANATGLPCLASL